MAVTVVTYETLDAESVFSSYDLNEGETFVGLFNNVDDTDAVAVSLEPGETYTFTIDGWGGIPASDFMVTLLNSDGLPMFEPGTMIFGPGQITFTPGYHFNGYIQITPTGRPRRANNIRSRGRGRDIHPDRKRRYPDRHHRR